MSPETRQGEYVWWKDCWVNLQRLPNNMPQVSVLFAFVVLSFAGVHRCRAFGSLHDFHCFQFVFVCCILARGQFTLALNAFRIYTFYAGLTNVLLFQGPDSAKSGDTML